MTGLTEEARQAMQQRQYATAIVLYDKHLEKQPSDLRSLMEIGICHLLDGSQAVFLHIRNTMTAVIAKNGPLEGENRELWDYYLSLVRKVTGTALVLGSLAVSGCKENDPTFSGHKYSGGVQMPLRPPVQQQENTQAESQTNATASAAQADKSITEPPGTNSYMSAHRYSGGVYLEKTRVPQEGSKTNEQ